MPHTMKRLEATDESLCLPGAFFENFINALDEPFFVKDDAHRWVLLNDAFCRLMGKPREELIGKTDYDFFPKHQADVFQARDDAVLSTGKTDINQEEITWGGARRTALTKKSLYAAPETGRRFIVGVVRDITEYEEAKEEIMKGEERFEILLDSLSDGVCLLDDTWRIRHVNEAAAAIAGRPKEQLQGRMVADIFPQLLKTRLLRTFKRVMKYRKAATVADRLAYPNGENRWAEISVYPVREGVLSIARDITDRMRSMNVVKMRLNFEKALASCSQALLGDSDAGITLNRVLAILLRASGASRVYIFKNSTGLGPDLLTTQTHEVCAAGVKTQIENPLLNNFPYREGFSRWMEELGKANPIQGLVEEFPESEREGLKSQGIVSILVLPIFIGKTWFGFVGFDDTQGAREWHEDDIRLLRTAAEMIGIYLERTQAQGALSFEREQLLSVFESLNQIVYVADPNTYEILYANKYLKELFGKELVGDICYRALQNQGSPCEFCTNEKIIKLCGEPFEWEYRNPLVQRDLLITDRIIKWPDGRDARLEIAIDITDRKRLEAQLRQSQKMEAVGRLAGGVAHDFNNLLTAILGYADMLAINPAIDGEARLNAMEILKSAQRAGTLTQQLLAFGRKQLMRVEAFDLNELIRRFEGMLKRLIGENMTLVSELCPGPVDVKADPGQIEQIIVNLVVNARDAMPDGGKIRIRTEMASFGQRQEPRPEEMMPGEYVRLSVRDTGLGMDEKTKGRIFEPFFTTKGMGRGTGLGLSIVYGIVKQSGGYIYVQSEVGKGTKFEIYLPRAAEEAPKSLQPAGVEKPEGGSERILLVEDEQIVRQMITTSLRSFGYKVVEAENGKEALATCTAAMEPPVDLLITDVIMPEMGGRELADHFIRIYPNAKVLYMSGYTDDASVRCNVLTRDVPFLQKPFTPALLTKKVRELLDKK